MSSHVKILNTNAQRRLLDKLYDERLRLQRRKEELANETTFLGCVCGEPAGAAVHDFECNVVDEALSFIDGLIDSTLQL